MKHDKLEEKYLGYVAWLKKRKKKLFSFFWYTYTFFYIVSYTVAVLLFSESADRWQTVGEFDLYFKVAGGIWMPQYRHIFILAMG